MCRFLMMRSENAFEPGPVLETFRERCRTSVEYQGHGWGATWRTEGRWSRYGSLTPIWEDQSPVPGRADFLVVHARSAFRGTGIELANNMPFYHGKRIFVFNGELQGVRLRMPGRIGAEKVFNLIQQYDNGDLPQALSTADGILHARSDYVRALNIAVTDGEKIHSACRFNESPDYFSLHYRDDGIRAVCSEPLDEHFRPMRNGQRLEL